MKFAGSNYFLPREGKISIEQYLARQVFFLSIETYAHDVLISLKNKALPVYNQLFSITDSSFTDAFAPNDICWNYFKDENQIYYDDHLLPLKIIIDEWSEEYNLFDEWIKDMALKTIADWRKFPPPLNKKLSWYDEVKAFFTTNPIPENQRISSLTFTFSIMGWNPFFESWKKAERRIISKVRELLEKGYRKERESLAKDLAKKLGYVKMSKRQIEKHTRWLIEYQIHEKSSGKICLDENNRKKRYDDMQIYRDEENNEGNKRKDYNPDTISIAIKSTAKLLGLTRRTKRHPIK